DGGADGAAGYLGLKSGTKLRGKGFQDIPAGDRLVVLTPGGGGLGDTAERDRGAVEADLRDGLISREAASDLYGHNVD
ncbi:MAG: hypothetical protein MI806_01205, partial [Minwuiales bacterium]|nr:hypothetical protein [Minwuiales bacterium]